MYSGLIFSSICWLQLCSSRFLYSRRSRRNVGQISFKGISPANFTTRPSFRLVWKTYNDSPSTKRISGRQRRRVLAPLRVSPSRIFLNHREDSLLLVWNTLSSGLVPSGKRPGMQSWQWHLCLPGKWLCGSMVFSRSRMKKGEISRGRGVVGARDVRFRNWLRILAGYQNYQSDRPMKSIQLTVDQTAFRKSGVIARRTTKSERVSRSQVQSLRKKIDDSRSENQEQLDIYFDKGKRRSYFRSVIDNYFIHNDNQALFLDSEPNIMVGPPLLPRECMSSESSRVKPKVSISISRLKLKSKLSLLDFSMPQMSSLPVIEEGLNRQKRPSSVQQPSSFISIERGSLPEKDMEESLFYESNKSLIDNSQVDLQESFKLIAIRKGGKRLGQSKVYSSNDHQQLKRENSAKKVGMQVLWTPSANNSIEFPNYKTLREMCYSIVEDKNGEEPISLIYPSAYYSTLFANQCEELIDIVVSLVKGVAKGRGMVANNQIHMKNIMKQAEKEFVLTDWGCASIRQDFTVQGRTFNKQLGALCRDGNKWLVSPEYLAPEMLKAAQTGCYDHLWSQKGGVGSCDIWSIGCLIFEIITLVPLDCPYYCIVRGRDRRRGLFGNKLKSTEKILNKQRGFRNYALRCIRQEMRVRKEVRVSERLLDLLPRMLEENVECRVSAAEILMRLA